MKLEAYGDFLVVKRDAPHTMSKAGIMLPDDAVAKRPTGVVLSSPSDCYLEGRRVYLGVYAGEDVTDEDSEETLTIIHRDDVKAVILPEGKPVEASFTLPHVPQDPRGAVAVACGVQETK